MDDTHATPYVRIGGEAGLRRFTRRMYALMATHPDAAAARALHPPALDDSEQAFFEFMSGWLGGPPLFTERRGPVMLRRRHLPFDIGPEAIGAWLFCVQQALDDTVEDAGLRAFIWSRIEPLAWHMHNRSPLLAGFGPPPAS